MVGASTDQRSGSLLHLWRCFIVFSAAPRSSLPVMAPSPEDAPAASGAPGVPEPYTPPRCAVPAFPPIHAGGGGGRRLLRRAVRRRRKPLAVGLVMTAAALAASGAHGAAPRPLPATPRVPAAVLSHRPPREALVRAPVRIADAAVAALLHPGDRVDVLAGARVVAAGVTVVAVPEIADRATAATGASDGTGPGGALIVLAVRRSTASALSGAAMSSSLAVTLC